MKLKTLQTAYTQKSKIFLYPLLGIQRGVSITPIQTYLQWADYYTVVDNKLICNYYLRTDPEFKNFKEKILISNKYFEEFYELEDGTGAFVFDFSDYAVDYQKVINGKYSQLSDGHKIIVSNFFRNHPKHHVHILSYLNPKRFFADYAELLKVSPDLLESVGELCSIPDMDKETLQVFKKISNFELLTSTNIKNYD